MLLYPVVESLNRKKVDHVLVSWHRWSSSMVALALLRRPWSVSQRMSTQCKANALSRRNKK
eukprot:12210766-Prorocentrum_lima.AAC.1